MTTTSLRSRTVPDAAVLEIAEIMLRRRKRLGWTQEQVAEKIGCSQQAVCYWERGLNSPNLNLAIRWCTALGYDLWPTEGPL